MRSQEKMFLPWSFSVCIEHIYISGRNYLEVHIELFLVSSSVATMPKPMTTRVRGHETRAFFNEKTTPTSKKTASAVRDVILRKSPGIITAIDEDMKFPDSQDTYAFTAGMVKK